LHYAKLKVKMGMGMKMKIYESGKYAWAGSRSIALTLIAVIFTTVFLVQITGAASTIMSATISVEPSYQKVSPGEMFSMNISIDPKGEEIYGAQYELNFDPAILQVVEQTKGDFLTQDGASSIEVTNKFNNTAGRVEYGETRMGVENGVTGTGVLASITFRVVGATGGTDLILSNVTLSDPTAQPIPGVGVNNGAVTVETSVNVNTTVSIEPKNTATSPGDVFVINVTIDPAENEVYGAQYELNFDPAILQVIEQTKGDFLTQDGASSIEVTNKFNNTAGRVEYGETRMGVENGVTGTGVLASITFRVVGATGGTDLILSNVTLSDPNATRIDALINNGRVVIGGMPPCEAIISIPNITSTVTASAPIEIKNATNIGSCDLTLFFDPSVVRVSNVSGGDFDFIFSNLENTTAGSIRIAAFQGPSAGLNDNVVVANVTFMVVGSVGSSTPLTLDVTTLKDASPACNPIPYTIENGKFTVFLNGDVNGDGVVDIADCMYLAKHILGVTGFEHIIEDAAEVNGDGVVDIADCMYLAKHIIGIAGFEELK